MRTMSAREKVCKMAREAVVDEEKGRKEYTALLNAMYDWQDEANEADKIAISRIITDVTSVRNAESMHAILMAKIINNHCRGT